MDLDAEEVEEAHVPALLLATGVVSAQSSAPAVEVRNVVLVNPTAARATLNGSVTGTGIGSSSIR